MLKPVRRGARRAEQRDTWPGARGRLLAQSSQQPFRAGRARAADALSPQRRARRAQHAPGSSNAVLSLTACWCRDLLPLSQARDAIFQQRKRRRLGERERAGLRACARRMRRARTR